MATPPAASPGQVPWTEEPSELEKRAKKRWQWRLGGLARQPASAENCSLHWNKKGTLP